MRTHQPFESVDKAIHEDEDIASKSEYIYTAPQRILVRDTDEGGRKQGMMMGEMSRPERMNFRS